MHDPCEKICKPCARIKSSVQKKITSRVHGSSYSFEKNCLPCTQVKLSVRKKLPAVHKGQVIHSKKIGSSAHGSRYPFNNNYLCDQLRLSVQKQLASHSLQMRLFFAFMIIIIELTQIASGVYKHLCEWSQFICHFSAIFITLDYDTRFYSRLTLV